MQEYFVAQASVEPRKRFTDSLILNLVGISLLAYPEPNLRAEATSTEPEPDPLAGEALLLLPPKIALNLARRLEEVAREFETHNVDRIQ